jgi:indolepyruvate ferredoxin oxidoreductase beta subunit
MSDQIINILAVGVGGQGIIRLSDILANVAFRCGNDAKKSEIHGLAQRGGSVTSHIRWGKKVFSPIITEGEADYVLALEELEALRYAHFLKPGGTFIVNDFRIEPSSVLEGKAEYPADIDARLAEYGKVERILGSAIAKDAGNIKASNIAMLGALSKHFDILEATWLEVIKESLPEKLHELNEKAFAAGRAAGIS